MKSKHDIIKELATKYDKSMEIISTIVDYPFKYTANVIKGDSFDKVLINGFCKFESHEYRREYITKLKGMKL